MNASEPLAIPTGNALAIDTFDVLLAPDELKIRTNSIGSLISSTSGKSTSRLACC